MSSPQASNPGRGTDDGFTLVELVMSLIVLFMALTAAVQIITSMVATTVASRHIDLAMSVATETMEAAVAYNCGGELLDPYWEPGDTTNATTAAFYTALKTRCKIDTNDAGKPDGAATDGSYCPSAVTSTGSDATIDETFRRGYLPTFDQAQTDLGSRRFTVYKSAATFTRTSTTGALPVCTTIKMIWKHIAPFGTASNADDGTNDSLRLQRVVHVQWQEPRSTTVRWREIVQVAALPPDSKVVVNKGRITVEAGIGKSATLALPITGGTLTLGADESGFVNFPFLPAGSYLIKRANIADTTVQVTDADPAQCLTENSTIAIVWNAGQCSA